MVVAAVVEALVGGDQILVLTCCGAVTFTVGLGTWIGTKVPERVQLLDIFSTVAGAWLVMSFAGALPYVFTGALSRIDHALFESISGFTTTGATVLRPIEGTSRGLLFWRAITQWVGGVGVIVLVVAVLPTVGAGGFGLLEAESPGPVGERLTPRIRHTTARVWGVYVGFTLAVAVAYGLAGMSLYDAVAHSFTTVSTGGFSPYNASLGHFDSAAIEWIAIVAMFVAGCSLTLIYRTLRGKPFALIGTVEFRLYVTAVLVASLVVYFTADAGTGHDAFRNSLFAVVSVLSTTGYATADFGAWSQAAQSVLLLAMPIGAMAGSTAGGVKLVRVLAVSSFAHRATLRQLHPRLIRPVRIGRDVMDEAVANKVLGFLVLALACFGGGALLIIVSGTDMVTGLSASATTFGNVGPGLGAVGPTHDFNNLPAFGLWVSMGNMLFGRLEIYPILLALVALPRPWLRSWRRWRSRHERRQHHRTIEL
jgi:trk system potassium uptake protein TrkH